MMLLLNVNKGFIALSEERENGNGIAFSSFFIINKSFEFMQTVPLKMACSVLIPNPIFICYVKTKTKIIH